MTISRMCVRVMLGGAAFLAAAAAGPTSGHAEVDFAGETITLVVPFGEGGGTDRYARMYQPFMEKYLPGNPTVLVLNKPGGASVLGANWFEREAKPDGLTVFLSGSSTMTAAVLGGDNVEFDMLNWRPIVVSPTGTCFYTHPDTGVTGEDPAADLEKLRASEWIVGAQNPGSSSVRYFLALAELEVPIRYVWGLESGDRRNAFLRDEVGISIDTTGSCLQAIAPLEERGDAVIFMTLGYRTSTGEVVRDPAFPNLYTAKEAYEAVNGSAPSSPRWKAIEEYIDFTVMTNLGMFLPNDTSDDIFNAYLAAVEKTLADPEFKILLEREAGGYPQLLGSEAANVIRTAVEVDPENRAWIEDWMSKAQQ